MTEPAIAPFRVHVPDDVLDDLQARLARARLPAPIPGLGWAQGMSHELLVDLVHHWRHRFDWRAAEARLNARPMSLVTVDGVTVHVLHQRSRHANARALVLTHGWPGTWHEFEKLVDPLVDPTAHGGTEADAFHVICPSLLGFGFSDQPSETGWNAQRIGALNARVVRALGYDRYLAHGTDWGSFVTSFMAMADPERCAAVHVTSPWAAPTVVEAMMAPFQREARATFAQALAMTRDESGYRDEQATKPQTLGFGLNDSPVGLLAWIVEKYRAWTDCGGDVLSVMTRDELLTLVTIYWATGTITSSMRIYWEAVHGGGGAVPKVDVRQPTGCVVFPKDVMKVPRSWADNGWNVQRWTEMPRGGHFSAIEQPGLLVDDLRAFFAGR